jgi:hypothetical protein
MEFLRIQQSPLLQHEYSYQCSEESAILSYPEAAEYSPYSIPLTSI